MSARKLAPESRRRRSSAVMARALMASLLLAATGCATGAGLQDSHYYLTNKTRAELSWLTSNSWSCRRELGGDYGKGYKQGYYDAATGRACTLPAVPPPCYWSSSYQSCEGQACIQAWYRGYQCGAAAARGDGYPSFHEVPVGPCAPTVNVTGCQGCTAVKCPCESVMNACQDKCNHDFHDGLFGQYGSEIVHQSGIPMDAAHDSIPSNPIIPDQANPASTSPTESVPSAPVTPKPPTDPNA